MARLLGPDDRSLLIGRSSSVRRWVAKQLGRGPKPKGRPRPDLRGVARVALAYPATGGFRQRLVYERLMAESVPLEQRRDLPAPAWLHLDPGERFPRLAVKTSCDAPARLHGPFRDRAAAARARDELNRQLALRPCEYEFEPAPDLPLGLGCVYAQVRTCSAPCLARIDEAGYRAVCHRAESLLAHPAPRSAAERDWLPEWVAACERPALVAEAAPEGLELYPIRSAQVLEEGAVLGGREPAEALSRVRWIEPSRALADAAWLSDWLSSRTRAGLFLVAPETGTMLDALAAALAAPAE